MPFRRNHYIIEGSLRRVRQGIIEVIAMEIERPPDRRARGRPRQYDRQQALEIALTLFQARGYEGTSIADLTDAIGVTATSLYGAFRNKEALFEEAVALYQQRDGAFAAGALERPGTTQEAIRTLLTQAAKHYAVSDRPGGCFIALGLLSCGPNHHAIAQRMAARRIAAREAIKARLDRGQSLGELPETSDTQALAAFYAATLQGLSVQARDGASEQDLQAIVDLALIPLCT